MDTVTLVRSAIRGLLKVADADLADRAAGAAGRDDDYAAAGKPVCDYDDAAARAALVDALARDATALLAALDGRELGRRARPGRPVAGHRGRPGPRPGHRRGVSHRAPGRQGSGDLHGGPAGAARAQDLRARVRRLQGPPRRRPGLGDHHRHHGHRRQQPATPTRPKTCWPTTCPTPVPDGNDDTTGRARRRAAAASAVVSPAWRANRTMPRRTRTPKALPRNNWRLRRCCLRRWAAAGQAGKRGRADYDQGAAAARAGRAVRQGPLHHRPDRGTVTCPGMVSVAIRPAKNGGGAAAFGTACAGCPLAAQCTTSPAGRTITISAYEPQLARARAAQADPAWQADYTRHPTQGRTQDRSPDAAPPRRPTCPRPRHGQGRRRLLPARRRGQPGPSRHARPTAHRPRLGRRCQHDHRNPLLGSQFP